MPPFANWEKNKFDIFFYNILDEICLCCNIFFHTFICLGDEWEVVESEKDTSEDTLHVESKSIDVQEDSYGMVGNGDEIIHADDIEDDIESTVEETEANYIKTETETAAVSDNDPGINDTYDMDNYDSEEEMDKSRSKRKRSRQCTPSTKLKKGTTRNKDMICRSISSEMLLGKELTISKTGEHKTPDQRKKTLKNKKEPATDISNTDLGFGTDPARTALEIELQETDDIDHYETIHKSLAPDEPYTPPSDVQETDGYSPSLGCYYCHDCGYTFQLERWFRIHKWNGKCVFECHVCAEFFTFRNISKYRTHMKTHK